MIVSSQMYDIPASFPSASKVDWTGENINEKYKALARISLLLAPKPSHEHWNKWNLGFPRLPVCWLHSLVFIKMPDQFLGTFKLSVVLLANKGWAPKFFPMAYSKHLFHNVSRRQNHCCLFPFNKSDFIWIVDSKNILRGDDSDREGAQWDHFYYSQRAILKTMQPLSH